MTRDSELLAKIFELTGGALETSNFPMPDLRPVLDGMIFARVHRISRFWSRGEHEQSVSLERSVEDLVLGFHGAGAPWMFLLRGCPTSVECWFGAAESRTDRPSLRSNLYGAFPDVRFHESIVPDKASIERLRHAAVLTGVPGLKHPSDATSSPEQIEKLCRGLYGSDWLYAVHAQPLEAAEVAKMVNQAAEQIRTVHATYLLKASATDESDRLAKRYVELLEERIKRLEVGRTVGMWRVHAMLLTDNALSLGRGRALLQSAFGGEQSPPVRVRPCTSGERENPIQEPLASRELAVLVRPPREEFSGYEVVDYARFGVKGNTAAGIGTAVLGAIYDRGSDTGNTFNIPLRDLTKHGLITGVTGSGKTNTCFALLDQVWNAGRGVPFLVIESAKSEYRSLLLQPRFKGLRVFTIGDETTSPLRLNPFEVPNGVLVQTHIDYVKSLFGAAFVLYPPMPYVLEQSLHEIYEDRGWDLAQDTNRRGATSARRFPSLADLTAKIGVIVNRMGYDERLTMDVKAGLLARINQLRLGGGKGLMLGARRSTNFADLLQTPCVIELKQIVSDDEKAFIMGLLLVRLYEHHEGRASAANGELVHLTLIEEAHRLLRNVSTEQGSDVSANPKGQAIEVFANILSEIRAFGEGILMAEQIPVKLTPDAIKNTNLKIVHRLFAEDDRRAVGSAMNLTEVQTRHLTILSRGEAAASMEGMQKAVLVRVPLAPAKDARSVVTAGDVRNAMRDFRGEHASQLLPFAACADCLGPQPGSRCGRHEAERTDGFVREAFLRLLNAMRLNKALIFDGFADFLAACQHTPCGRDEEGSMYCLFVELVESEVERRGEFAGWQHDEVEQFIALACRVTAMIAREFRKGGRAAIEKACAKDMLALSALTKRLHKAAPLPFIGCRFCMEPCHYRFDMRPERHRVDARDFRDGFIQPKVAMAELARLPWEASGRCFPALDVRTRRGAAFCFAVQQFHDLGLTRRRQEEMSEQMNDALSTFTT